MVDFSYEDLKDLEKAENKTQPQLVDQPTTMDSTVNTESDDLTYSDLSNLKKFEPRNKTKEAIEDFSYGLINQANWIPFFDAFVRNTYKGLNEEDKNKTYSDFLSEELKKSKEREARSPIASNVGNIAGGLLLPSGGGVAMNVAGKLGAKGVGKVGANILGNAVEGATQSALFSDEGNRVKSALIGAGMGGLLPTAMEGAKGLIKGGKVAKKYAERVDDIKAQREAGVNIVDQLEQDTKNQIAKVQKEAENDAFNFADNLQKEAETSLEKSQILDQQLIDTSRDLNKAQLKIMSEESTLGWNALSKEKDIDVTPMVDELNRAIEQLDPSDPNVARMKRWVDDLQKDKIRMSEIETELSKMEKADPLFGTTPPEYEALKKEYEALKKSNDRISEYDLKRKLNSFWNEINESEVRDLKKGVYVPLSSRELMNVAGIGRDILINKNKVYADIVQPLSERVNKIKKINSVLKFDKDDATALRTLKSYKGDKAIRDQLDEYKKVTGTDLLPLIDKTNDIRRSASSSTLEKLKKDGLDLVDVVVNSDASSKNYVRLERDLTKFDEINGTNYAQQLRDLRQKHTVDLLNKAKKYVSKDDPTKPSKLSKNAYNILPVSLEAKQSSPIGRILNRESNASRVKRSAKDKASRQMIEDITRFISKEGDNVDDAITKNIQSIENNALYDLMGTSSANGSRRVNLGANLGEWLHEGLKGNKLTGRAYGSTIGALIDNGVLQRTRRELLERLLEQEKNPRSVLNPISGIPNKIGARVLAPQVSKEVAREEQSMQSWDNLFKKENQVASQINTNETYFGRSGVLRGT